LILIAKNDIILQSDRENEVKERCPGKGYDPFEKALIARGKPVRRWRNLLLAPVVAISKIKFNRYDCRSVIGILIKNRGGDRRSIDGQIFSNSV
jgi:hypothetical protein